MAGLDSAIMPGLSVFNGVTGYMNRQRALELQAQAQADRQAAAAQKAADAAQKKTAALSLLNESQQQEQDQLRASLEATQAADYQDGTRKLAQIAQSASETERKRQNILSATLASAAAGAGGHNIDPNDGSALAVRLGRITLSDADRAAAQADNALKVQSLNDQLQERYQRNLLQQSQLADRQRLQYLSRYYE